MNKCKDCLDCHSIGLCCREGVWVDLEEAKKIGAIGEFAGEFHHLTPDDTFPSGWKISTSYMDGNCTFLDTNGLCKIHKTDYHLKPKYCKEFPHQDGELSEDYERLCNKLKING